MKYKVILISVFVLFIMFLQVSCKEKQSKNNHIYNNPSQHEFIELSNALPWVVITGEVHNLLGKGLPFIKIKDYNLDIGIATNSYIAGKFTEGETITLKGVPYYDTEGNRYMLILVDAVTYNDINLEDDFRQR